MKFRFWGVRGSIPSPGPRTARYGGNTTCIEVRTDDDTLIVLDGGTGLFPLAQHLLAQPPVHANLFITHSHWDHIHGLPFFTPLFVKGSRVRLHGAHDPVTGRGIEHVMGVQLQNSYFPVGETDMSATIEYCTLTIGEPIAVGDALVANVVTNHPVTNLGYRIDCNGKSVFFTGDHEPWYNPHAAGPPLRCCCPARASTSIPPADVPHTMTCQFCQDSARPLARRMMCGCQYRTATLPSLPP